MTTLTHLGELWPRLCQFPFDDPGAEFPFTARLAEENGWTVAFATLATEEYRRFLYLAATCGHPVVPSEVVDKVWHLHLLNTRSYWDDLCRGILGRPLHHDPSPGGQATAREGHTGYEQTLASYRRAFGEPPVAIWPPLPVEQRRPRRNCASPCSCNSD